jgi:glycosyltransferase involved in cell wall biosynthesis
MRLVLLSGNPLCHNPRVFKEAEVLAGGGYEVEVLGSGASLAYRQHDEKLAAGKKWKFTGLLSDSNAAKKILFRARGKLGNQAHRLFGCENYWQFGPMAELLWKEGKKRNADLYIAHSEAGMWAAEQLRKDGKSVGVDMEDWFSEDLLPEARRSRPIRLLKKLENNLLCEGVHSTCTSEAMADALVQAYGCRRPTVIRNVFPLEDREQLDGKWKDRPGMARWMPSNDPRMTRPQEAPVSIHWFSQTIGPGRGLETLFQTLDGLEGNWELHLRGNLRGYEKWLEKACPVSVRKKLKVHGLVDNKELLSRIAEHDIGFAGELSEPPSRNLTITNKFFQYLQAGLAVVASDTEGQMEGASEAKGVVGVFKVGNETELRARMAELIPDRTLLGKKQSSSWDAGTKLSWENEKTRFAGI